MWDEGFHILAARLISTGKRPYLDFIFAQTPLNAYWNAFWMKIFGTSWRVVHAVATLATLGSIALIVEYVSGLFPDRRWQSAAAFAALALFGLNVWVWTVGTVSQAYPLCLFLMVAAFRLAIVAVTRPRLTMSFTVGLLVVAAAASSLLAAPASPVLLIWMWFNNRAGNRLIKTAAFLAGAVVACIPLLMLFAGGPHQVLFDILKYHAVYRRLRWEAPTTHDIGIVTDWVNSSPDLLLALFALAGLFSLKDSGFDASRRAEFHLCLWLGLTIGAQNTLARPTFPMYFVFMIPFLTVLSVLGFYAVVTRLQENPGNAVIALLVIMILCLGNSLHESSGYYTWPELEQVAAKVKEVTPKDAPFLAPEHIYFLVGWPVPPGMEYDDSHKLDLAPAENAALHVLPKVEVDQQVKAGAFSTAVVCDEDDEVIDIKQLNVYSQTAEVQDCTVFWQAEKKNVELSQ